MVISYSKLDFNIFFIEKLSNLRYNENYIVVFNKSNQGVALMKIIKDTSLVRYNFYFTDT